MSKRTRWTPRDVWRERGLEAWAAMTPRQKAAYLGHPGEAFAAAFAAGALALDKAVRWLLDEGGAAENEDHDDMPEPAPVASEGDLPPVGGPGEAQPGSIYVE